MRNRPTRSKPCSAGIGPARRSRGRPSPRRAAPAPPRRDRRGRARSAVAVDQPSGVGAAEAHRRPHRPPGRRWCRRSRASVASAVPAGQQHRGRVVPELLVHGGQLRPGPPRRLPSAAQNTAGPCAAASPGPGRSGSPASGGACQPGHPGCGHAAEPRRGRPARTAPSSCVQRAGCRGAPDRLRRAEPALGERPGCPTVIAAQRRGPSGSRSGTPIPGRTRCRGRPRRRRRRRADRGSRPAPAAPDRVRRVRAAAR